MREPHDGRARARQPARDQHEQRRHQAQQHEHAGRGADEDRGDAPVIGERDGERRERATDQHGRDDVAPARPVPLARDLVAEQRRDRHVVGAAERPQREGRARSGARRAAPARARRDAAPARSAAAARRRSPRRSGTAARRRRRGPAARRARRAPAPGSDRSRTRAQPVAPSAFSVAITSRRRSRWPLTALATPTPPTSSAVEADQREILREALDVALERGRGVGARAHLPAGFRQLRLRRGRHGAHAGIGGVIVGQAQAIMPAHDAAGLQQAGRAQRRLADEEPRAEADAAGELVGLGRRARRGSRSWRRRP